MAMGKSGKGRGGNAASRKAADAVRLAGLRKDTSRPVSFRLPVREAELIEAMAQERHLRPGQLVRAWVLDRLEKERSR